MRWRDAQYPSREWIGNRNPTFASAGTFETKDGRCVRIAAGGDGVWPRLAKAMGRDDLATDARYATIGKRMKRADEMEAMLVTHAGEPIGAHNAEILGGLLGKPDAEVAELRQAGVI